MRHSRISRAVSFVGLIVILLLLAASATARTESLITISSHSYRTTGSAAHVGDQLFATTLLYNRRIREEAIGHATLICTSMGKGGPLGSGTSECFGTFVLPRGKITVHGSRKYRTYYLLAITGGTGLYSGVRGQLIVSSRGMPDGQQRLVFSLE